MKNNDKEIDPRHGLFNSMSINRKLKLYNRLIGDIECPITNKCPMIIEYKGEVEIKYYSEKQKEIAESILLREQNENK